MDDEKKVIINGIDIPFMDLVVLLIKLALASIPAMIVIFGFLSLMSTIFGGVFNLFMFRI
ncbi:hypothetical protein [Sulfurovum riftiae]|uniref:Uncharacterized protein n=1 Tax=Sulfurovum riftiae TaxID=1630136 RepID=A0A151CIB9_9BACT|nr:hypothetical protein [Sulfurovum riftiae]KYJ87239.1 hypothetical protein AS592_02550 [Sulfurovum riftiae]